MTTARQPALDYIRGFALLGILIVNAPAFGWPLEVYMNPARATVALTEADRQVWWIIHTFFESKCLTLFAMLFGISLFLVGQKDDPATPVTRTVRFRRLVWLAAIGVAHGAAIWVGDILLMYALCGLFFVLTIRTPHLLRWGFVAWLIGGLMVVGSGLILSFVPREELGKAISGSDGLNFADTLRLMQGGFAQSLHANFVMWAMSIFSQIAVFAPKVIGLMMIGLGLYRVGYFDPKKTGWHLGAVVVGAAALAVIGWQNLIILRENFPEPQIYGSHRAAAEFFSIFVSMGYASALMLISRVPVLKGVNALLSPVGRMAFTNYLSQSLIMTAVFYGGRGLGLYGQVSLSHMVPIVLGIWLFQIVFSAVWLKAFRYGPFEWVWRCLSHGRWVAIR
ncbi:DUF418 domain-containing protein [Asticcacaulis sp. AND118]|uniref:DUF418 domain-containing protein n=1 Tax=Asticcacaulis sp. AND118 TaxID=2840468 RepID=UPI001CFFE0BC|nr:DUF418 domain-containing protein [Asticcacaulis sp. AND118]UDF03859.1 DUF418 domain-containing protein [Asticcacaulis sp. AND118]